MEGNLNCFIINICSNSIQNKHPNITQLPKLSQVYLRRNLNGDIDPQGQIWAAPYRWGTMVIAYKKTKFQKKNLPPMQVTLVYL